MQPEIFTLSSPTSRKNFSSENLRCIDSAIGSDFAFARAQKSPPGQQITSDSRPKFATDNDLLLSFCQREGRSDCLTSASTMF